MKKKVSIFVAGSKDLRIERYSLKALAQELNTRYNEKAVDVFVEMKSYEDFKDNQKEYNSYITNKADMALFVLDGRIGKFTKSELITAVDAYKKKQIPEIVVFLKNFKEETSDIQQIMELLEDLFGKDFFYVNYEDAADLKFKAETRISRFISPTDHIRSTKKWKMITAMCACIALLFLAGMLIPLRKGSNLPQSFNKDDEMLLFLGGGSVYTFIEGTFDGLKIDSIDDIPNAIYMPTATGSLWSMIGEEYYRKIDEQKFFPIFLAADTIDMDKVKNVIRIHKDSFIENMIILQLYLGKDYLKVFTGPGFNINDNITKLDIGALKHYIDIARNKSLRNYLYTTSKGSGTWTIYKKFLNDSILCKEIEEDTVYHRIYNNRKSLNYTDPYLILASENYTPSNFDIHTTKNKGYYVINKDGTPVSKDIYLYFIAYAIKNTNGVVEHYKVPGQVVKFIQKLNEIHPICRLDSIWEDKEKGYVKKTKEDGLIPLTLEDNK